MRTAAIEMALDATTCTIQRSGPIGIKHAHRLATCWEATCASFRLFYLSSQPWTRGTQENRSMRPALLRVDTTPMGGDVRTQSSPPWSARWKQDASITHGYHAHKRLNILYMHLGVPNLFSVPCRAVTRYMRGLSPGIRGEGCTRAQNPKRIKRAHASPRHLPPAASWGIASPRGCRLFLAAWRQ